MTHRYKTLSKGRVAQRGVMNKTEAEYSDMLVAMKRKGDLHEWWFEPVSLRLSHPPNGQPARYTPDFLLLYPSGRTVLVDVKGTGLDDAAAIVRIKCAAEQYPLWEFWVVKKKTKKQGGGWKVMEV